MTCTAVCNGSNILLYTNGAIKNTSYQPVAATVGTKLSFIIGGENNRNHMSINGELCTIRFYNRALTAEEIAHNYAVDKERFRLP